MDTPEVSSSPVLVDTDWDGIDDAREYQLGTNPERSDTDGDGVDDERELVWNDDPTIHDYRPPELDINHASFYKPPGTWKATYFIKFSTRDIFGLEEAIVKHNDEIVWERHPRDRIGHGYNLEYQTDDAQSIIDGLKGAAARVKVTDTYGNSRQVVALERNTVYVTMAEKIGLPINTPSVAKSLGMFSGITAGAGETAAVIEAFISDPTGFIDSMTELVELVKNAPGFHQLMAAMAQQYEDQMRVANPYDAEKQPYLYQKFRTSYYAGFIFFEASKAVAGGSAASAVKSSSKFQKFTSKLDESRLSEAVTALSKTRDTLHSPVRYVKSRVAAKLSDAGHLGLKASGRILDSSRTIGSTFSVRHYLDGIGARTLSKLSPADQRYAGRLLNRLHGNGDEFLARADAADIEEMRDVQRAVTDGGYDVDRARLWSYRMSDALASGDISSQEFDQLLETLEAADLKTRTRLMDDVAEYGPNGIRAINRASEVDIDGVDSYELARNTLSLQRKGVSGESVEDVLKNLKQIENVEGADRLAKKFATLNTDGEFRGYRFMTRYAAEKKSNLIGIEKSPKTGVSRPGDIDLVTGNGDNIIGHELKYGNRVTTGDIKVIKSGFEKMVGSGELDNFKFAFRRRPSDDVIDYLEKNDISFEISSSD